MVRCGRWPCVQRRAPPDARVSVRCPHCRASFRRSLVATAARPPTRFGRYCCAAACASRRYSASNASSSFDSVRAARSSGRRCHVLPSDCFSRQRRIAAWWPDSSTVGHRLAAVRSPAACSADSRAVRRRTSPARADSASFSTPGTLPHHRVDQHQRRQLAARHHEIADRRSPRPLRARAALVDPFVAARQQHVRPRSASAASAATRACVSGAPAGDRWIVRVRSHAGFPLRRTRRRRAPAASGSRQHHHPRSAAVRPIVDGPVVVGREIPRIPHPELPQPALAAPAR